MSEGAFRNTAVLRRLLDVYRLFVSQGKSLIDRYYVAAGGTDIDMEMRGYDKLKELLSRRERA